jgi:hypothetical protein
VTDLYLKRLTPEDPMAWGYWPLLEARIRAALPRLEPDAPAEVVIRKLRGFWGAQPARLGAWLALRPGVRTNGHRPPPQLVGHFVAWLTATMWDEPILFGYQLDAEAGAGAWDLRDAMLRELDVWKEALNANAERLQLAHRVDRVELYTLRPAAFARWFRPVVAVQQGGTLIAFRLSQVALPSVEVGHG